MHVSIKMDRAMFKKFSFLLFFFPLTHTALATPLPSEDKIRRIITDTKIADAVIEKAESFFFGEALAYHNDEILNLLEQKAFSPENVTALALVADTHAKKLYFSDTHDLFKVDILKAIFTHFEKPIDMILFCDNLAQFKSYFITFNISPKDWCIFVEELAAIQREAKAFKADLSTFSARKVTLYGDLTEDHSVLYAVKRVLPHRTGEDLQAFLNIDFTPLFSDDMRPFSRAEIIEALAASNRTIQDIISFIDNVSKAENGFAPRNADGYSKATLLIKLATSRESSDFFSIRRAAIAKYSDQLFKEIPTGFDQTRVIAAILSSWRGADEIEAFSKVFADPCNTNILFKYPHNLTYRASIMVGYAQSHRAAVGIIDFAKEFKSLESDIYTNLMSAVHHTKIAETFAQSTLKTRELSAFVKAVNVNRLKFFTPPMDGQFQQEIWQALVQAGLNANDIYRIAGNIKPFKPCRDHDLYAAYDHKKIILEALE